MDKIEELRTNIVKLKEVSLLFSSGNEGFRAIENKINSMVDELAALENPHKKAKDAIKSWTDQIGSRHLFSIIACALDVYAIADYIKHLEEELSNRPDTGKGLRKCECFLGEDEE